MNVIDFHTHVFPEKIAERTIQALEAACGCDAFGNGTLQSLLDRMQQADVTYSVTLPVVTKPAQFDTILKYAQYCNTLPNIIAFGGIHPADTEIEAHLEQIKESGLLGVKIHPDYQQTVIDDPAYVRILKKCVELDLLVVTHAGFDAGYPNFIHATPERVLHLMEMVYAGNLPNQPTLILAHGGGNELFDDVEKLLCGLPVYFDLSYILGHIAEDSLLRILAKHGAENILFATDFPWNTPEQSIAVLQSLPISQKEKDLIFYHNAAKLLHIG